MGGEISSDIVTSSTALVPFQNKREYWSKLNGYSEQDWLAMDKEYLNHHSKTFINSFPSDNRVHNLNNILNPSLRGGGGNVYSIFHQQLEKEIIEEFLKVIKKERMERLKLGMAIEKYSAATKTVNEKSNFENDDNPFDKNDVQYNMDIYKYETKLKSQKEQPNLVNEAEQFNQRNTNENYFENFETIQKREKDMISYENPIMEYV